MPQNNSNIFKVLILIVTHFSTCPIWAKASLNIFTWNNLPLNQSIKKSLYKEVYVDGHVFTQKNKQYLSLIGAGLHAKRCAIALSRISQYENYNKYISFIEQSSYNERSKYIKLQIDHVLMPFPMILNFKIDRMTKQGNYNFHFERGLLKGLKGSIKIGQHKKRCLFFITANWDGSQTKIPDSIFSLFLEVLTEKLINKLFLISRTL